MEPVRPARHSGSSGKGMETLPRRHSASCLQQVASDSSTPDSVRAFPTRPQRLAAVAVTGLRAGGLAVVRTGARVAVFP